MTDRQNNNDVRKTELRRRLLLQRVTDMQQLSPDERRTVLGDIEGAREVDTTRALGKAPLPEHASPEPQKERMLDKAYERLENDAAGTPGTGAGAPRRIWAVGTALISIAVIAAILLWPAKVVQNGPDGLEISPAATAWASVDGYVIELELVYPRPDPAMDEEELEANPAFIFYKATEDWKLAHTESAENPTGILLKTSDMAGLNQFINLGGQMALSEFVLRLFSADEALLQDLLATLAPLPGVEVSQVSPEKYFYSDKYPEVYTPGRLVIVDGVEYRFPEDIEEPYLKILTNIFLIPTRNNERPSGSKVSYRSFFNFYNSRKAQRPLIDADIIREEFDSEGNLLLTTYLADWKEIKKPLGSSIFVDPAEADADFDPRPLLLDKMTRRAAPYENSLGLDELENGLENLIVSLIPRDRWLAGGENKITSAEAEHSQQLARTVNGAVKQWYADHRDKIDERTFAAHHWLDKEHRFGDAVIALTVHAGFDDEELAKDLYTVLVEAAPSADVTYTRKNENILPPLDHRGIVVPESRIGWLASDCILVAYDVLHPGGSSLDVPVPEQYFNQLVEKIQQWINEKTEQSKYGVNPAGFVQGIPRRSQPNSAIKDSGTELDTLDLVIYSDDEVLLQELTGLLSGQPGVSQPVVNRQKFCRFSRSSQFNRDLFPQRDVIVDGEHKTFPIHFDPLVVTDLYNMMLRHSLKWKGSPGVDYHARGYRRDPGPYFLKSPYSYGDIISMTVNEDGQYVINTINDQWKFLSAQGNQQSMKWRISVPSNLAKDGAFDPQQELEDKWQMMTAAGHGEAGEVLAKPKHSLTWPLLDPRYLATRTQAEIDPELVRDSIVRHHFLSVGFSQWLAEHPELATRPAVPRLAVVHPTPTFGEACLAYSVMLRTDDADLVSNLAEHLTKACGGLSPVIEEHPGLEPPPDAVVLW